ncbi:MAG: hypothetical protein AAGH87_04545 [Pseudomonadota bacterium]
MTARLRPAWARSLAGAAMLLHGSGPLALAEGGPAELDPTIEREIDLCRSHIGAAAANPSASGGVSFITVTPEEGPSQLTLCLAGTLGPSVVQSIRARVDGNLRIDRLIVRSTGGAVADWLAIAEMIENRVEQVVVDQICMSSCAVYAFAIAERRLVTPGSLVVWHGGPSPATIDLIAPDASDEIAADLEELSQRTAALYDRLDLSLDILRDTQTLSLSPNDADMLAQASEEGSEAPLDIDGYALDPQALSRCYGYSGLEEMWHPGFSHAVFTLGRRRSADLTVLMRPWRIELPACASEPG